MKGTCFDCQNLSYIKHTKRGQEPVCRIPGCPPTWNENRLCYSDIAKSCDDYIKSEDKRQDWFFSEVLSCLEVAESA